MINPRLLDVFVSVVRTGSTVAAARTLNTSQPSVSRAVSDLEFRIGLTLFSRSRGRMTLTREGEYFYAEVERFFAGTSELLNKAREIKNFEDTVLRVASITAASFQVIPNSFNTLLDKIGDIRTSYQMRSHYKTVDLVVTGRADIGVCNSVPQDMAVTVRREFDLRCVLAVPPGHRLDGKQCATVADIESENFISLGPEFNAQHIEDPKALKVLERISRRTTNLSLPACSQVASGLGIAIIDPLTARFHDRLGVKICAFQPKVRYPVAIIESRANPKSRLNDLFVEVLSNELQRDLT